MRSIFFLVLAAPLVASCTPLMPMKDDFGTSAAIAKGPIPPEYARFNAYDPGANALLADQICATPYEPRDVAVSNASPGQLAAAHTRCATHVPLIGAW